MNANQIFLIIVCIFSVLCISSSFFFSGKNSKVRMNAILSIFMTVVLSFVAFFFFSESLFSVVFTVVVNLSVVFVVFISIFNNQKNMITRDSLTGLNNRSALKEYVNAHIMQDNTYVIVADMNKFKSINDNYGHTEGDNALKLVSKAFKRVGGKYHKLFISRFGGDEFVFLFTCKGEDDILTLIEELNNSVEMENRNVEYTLSVSFGYSKIENSDFELSFLNADKHMYKVKNG